MRKLLVLTRLLQEYVRFKGIEVRKIVNDLLRQDIKLI